MSKVLGVALLWTVMAVAQEHGAVPATRQPDHGAPTAGQEHAQAAVQHGEGHEQATMPNEIWWKWANFALLAGVLGYLAAKNGGPFFRARTAEIQKGIQDAAKVRADAEARAAEIEARVANLAGEVETLRAKSREEIGAEGARVQAETAAQIAKVQSRAEAEIASTAKQASLQLKAYSAQLALDLAEKQIRQRLDAQTQTELAGAFIEDLRQHSEQQLHSQQQQEQANIGGVQ